MTTKFLSIHLLVDVSDMDESELGEAMYEPEDEDEPSPVVGDYRASEVASGIPFALNLAENKAELLAGSDIFVKLGEFRTIKAEWVP